MAGYRAVCQARWVAACERDRSAVVSPTVVGNGGLGSRTLGRDLRTKLPLPIILLRIAQPKSEDGVGQLPALAVAGMHPHEDGSVVATLGVPRVELRGMHGVVLGEG